MLMSGLRLSDVNKETTYLLTYNEDMGQVRVLRVMCAYVAAFLT